MAGRKYRKLQESAEATVDRIMRSIALGLWIPGVTEQKLADRLGASVDTVKNYAREAARRIHAGVLLDEELRESILLQLQTNAALGQGLFKAAKQAGEYQGAVGALRAKNEALKIMSGLRATAKQRDDVDDLSGKSERELLEIIAKSSIEKKDE